MLQTLRASNAEKRSLMWALVVTNGPTEFLVRDRLNDIGVAVFLPYTREKQREEVKIPRTRANPRPRTYYKAVWRDVVRWPRYLFARAPSNEELSDVAATKDVNYIVRSAEGEPARLPDHVMSRLMIGCDTDGRVLKGAELLGFQVGDLLRFVTSSSFAGHSAQVLSIEDNNTVRVLIDGRINASVNYKELSAIG